MFYTRNIANTQKKKKKLKNIFITITEQEQITTEKTLLASFQNGISWVESKIYVEVEVQYHFI